MIRKLFTSLLCLMLALMLPLCAMADTRYTLQIVPGDDLASVQAVKDLFDTLTLSLTTSDTAGALSVGLGGTDIVNFAVTADETGLYAHSNLLSDDVLYVTWDEAFTWMEDSLKASMEAAGAMDEEALAAMQQVLEQYKTMLPALMSGKLPTTGPAYSTPEEAMALLEKMFPDDPDLLSFYKDMFSKMVIEDGEFADAARDTATRKYSLTMDGKDMAAICDTRYMRSTMEQSLAAANPDMTAEQLAAAVEEAIAESKKVFTEGEMLMTMEVYTVDEGMTLVGMEMGMDMTMPANAEAASDESMTMNMNYDRLTSDTGVSHKADMGMTVENEPLMDMVFDLTQGKDGVSEGMLAVLADGELVTFTYHGENADDARVSTPSIQPLQTVLHRILLPDDVRVRTLNIYQRSGATAAISPAASERPIIGFKVTSASYVGDLLKKVEAADAQTAVNVLKLSADEQNTLINNMQTRLMQAVYTGMSLLPASVIQMIAGGTAQ